MAPKAQTACVVCGEPAPNKCGACKSDTSSYHYCGKACQAKDWPTHKKSCKDIQNAYLEKKLARVADIVVKAYYGFRENTWDTPVTRVVDGKYALVIYDDIMLNKKEFFLKFPQHLVSNDLTKHAMLCAWACNEPMAWMHNILIGLLEGLNVKVEEVTVNLGYAPRKITVHNPYGGSDTNWPGYKHEVIRITASSTKKQWLIDISGAQYGIHRAFWRWEDYKVKYFTETDRVQAIGTNKSRLKILAKIPGNPYLCYGLVGVVADHLDEVVSKWSVNRGLSLASLLDMDDGEYQQASSELLRTMDAAVGNFVETLDYKTEFQAAQSYERKNPGKSAMICTELTKSFFAKTATATTG